MRVHLIIGLMLLFGCVQESPAVDRKDRAKEYLNHRQFQAAIALLDELHRANPRDDETSVLLASAYAGSVGINVIDSLPIFQTVLIDQRQSHVVASESDLPRPPGSADDTTETSAAHEIANFFDDVGRHFRTVEKIPHVPIDERKNLVEAFLVLRTVSQDSAYYQRARSYSALISMLQFLNFIRDSLHKPNQNGSPDESELICQVKMVGLVDNMTSAIRYLSIMSDDLTEVMTATGQKELPGNLKNVQENAQRVVEIFETHRESVESGQLVERTFTSSICR